MKMENATTFFKGDITYCAITPTYYQITALSKQTPPTGLFFTQAGNYKLSFLTSTPLFFPRFKKNNEYTHTIFFIKNNNLGRLRDRSIL